MIIYCDRYDPRFAGNIAAYHQDDTKFTQRMGKTHYGRIEITARRLRHDHADGPLPGAAFSNPRMILKRVWVGKGAGVGSDLLSRGQGRGGCEGAGGRSSGACSRSAATFLSMGLLSPRAAVSLRAQPGRREPGGRAKVPAARCPPTTASGSRPAVLSCAAASAAHTRCRSSGRLAAPEKQP